MKFNVFSELSYEVFTQTTFIFNIQVAQSASQVILEESFLISPEINYEEFSLPNADTRFIRLTAEAGTLLTLDYSALAEVDYTVNDFSEPEKNIPVIALDSSVIPFLFSSRHCESDKLRKLANKEFGHYVTDFDRVNAVSDWIFNNIDYVSGTTDSGTSACDTLIQREGVCKDFAHLGIALCRALDIPARYFTGYACNIHPPDFHACFEAYINGKWIFFDPTRLVPVNGLVRIANSIDAGDAAVASFFGNTNCMSVNVQCFPAGHHFKPIYHNTEEKTGICYEEVEKKPIPV